MLFAVATIEAKLDEDAVVPEAQLSVASAAKRKKPCLTAKQIKAVKHLISQGITAAKVKAETKRMHKEEAAYAYQKPEYEAADKKLKRMMKKEKDIVIKEKDHKFLKGHGKLPKTQELLAMDRKKPCLTKEQVKAVNHLISQGLTASKVKEETKRMHEETASYAYLKPEEDAASKALHQKMMRAQEYGKHEKEKKEQEKEKMIAKAMKAIAHNVESYRNDELLDEVSSKKKKKPCLTKEQVKAVNHLISQGITASKVKEETKRMHEETASYAYLKPDEDAAGEALHQKIMEAQEHEKHEK